MEIEISFGLKHPPSSMKMSALCYEDAVNCVLFGTKWFADFRAKYGHLTLVFQELEQELKSTVHYMKAACEKRGLAEEFEAESHDATFEMLIRMFSSQLDQSNGSKDLIRSLHEARKYRNRLAHQFLDPKSMEYHLSAGGRAKTIHQLDARIDFVMPLVMIVHRVGRAYASDVGMTDEVIARIADLKRESLGLEENQMFTYVTGKTREDKGETDFDVNAL